MTRALFVAACLIGCLQAQSAEDVFRAVIRANDLDTLKRLPVNIKDRLDNTPLHYAALYGSMESVRILLDRGADVKARNKSEATPLIYGAYNFDKARLLVEKGSDVNAEVGGRDDASAGGRLRPRQHRDSPLSDRKRSRRESHRPAGFRRAANGRV